MISRSSINGAFPIKRLGEVVEFLDSQRRPVTESDRRAGPYPYYGANGQQDSVDDYIFDEPLVLLAEDGGHFGEPERGIAYRISGKTWVNNHAHVLRPKSSVDLAYLCRVLENYDVTPFITGTTRGKLTKAGASEIVIPLPPLAEQRRIAEVLDRAEALRAERRAALAQLDFLTQSIFLDLFGDPVSNPKRWPLRKLHDVLDLLTYGLTVRPEYISIGIPLISAKEIRAGVVATETAAKISQKDFDGLSEKAKPVEGDILFSKTGSIGHSAIVRSKSPIALAQNAARLTFKTGLVDGTYALFYLRTKSIRSLAQMSARGNAVKDLQLGVMKQFPFPLPPLELQREFARRVRAVEKLKAAQHASLAELDALFASLQHRAFRGEL